MTLHEAIVHVLKAAGGSLESAEIARQINAQGIYRRGDGKPLPTSQISVSVGKHTELFERTEDGEVALIGGPKKSATPKTAPTKKAARAPEPSVEAEVDPEEMAARLAKAAVLMWPVSTLPFQELGTVSELLAKGLPTHVWLRQSGIYAIVAPADYDIGFLDLDTIYDANNVINPWSNDRLHAKWVPQTRVVYIGVAGNRHPRSLRQELKDLIRHARGETTDRGPHRNGEIVWQLRGYGDFTVMALPTDGPPAPKTLEQDLLARFTKRHKVVPFGNRKA